MIVVDGHPCMKGVEPEQIITWLKLVVYRGILVIKVAFSLLPVPGNIRIVAIYDSLK